MKKGQMKQELLTELKAISRKKKGSTIVLNQKEMCGLLTECSQLEYKKTGVTGLFIHLAIQNSLDYFLLQTTKDCYLLLRYGAEYLGARYSKTI